jgi:hypothetical protein
MEFPHIVRLREKIITELPSTGIFVAQPIGKQCYVWFTDHGCFFVDVYKHSWKVDIVFDKALCGTIFLGTIVHYEQVKTILVYDIFYKQGQPVSSPFMKKWNMIIELLVRFVRNRDSSYYVMMPNMSTTAIFDPLYKMYSIKWIQEDIIYHKLEKDKETKKEKEKPHFMVRSTTKSDIYMIYKNGDFDSYACVNTLSKSEYMNSIFHTTPDFIEKEYSMECEWSDVYKKWIPIKLK